MPQEAAPVASSMLRKVNKMLQRLRAQRAVIQNELAASLVVFLVALPLSMGIALASGAPVFAGLIAAAAGGIVGGLLGGAPLMVSGPATGLAVIVVDISERFGFAAVSLVTLLAGLLQLLLGSAKVARYATAIAPAVLHGMLAGIGMLIAVAQLHVILGHAPDASFFKNVAALPHALVHANLAAASLGACTMAILVAWPHLPLFRLRIPPALAAVGMATAAAAMLNLPVARVHLPDTFAWLPPRLGDTPLLPLLAATLGMALIASAESLLSAVAVDKLHNGPRARLDRELLAQGAANVVSGLLGGLPITGVIVRSTANIEAGAKSRWSTVLHGVWIVVAVATLSGLLNQIPLVALAGLLVVVGTRLVSWNQLRELHRHGESAVYLATVTGVVGINLLAGICMGLTAAVLKLFWQLTRARIRVCQEDDRRFSVNMHGAITFLLVPELTEKLAALPAGREIRLNIEALLVDHAATEALKSWQNAYEGRLGADGQQGRVLVRRAGGHQPSARLHKQAA